MARYKVILSYDGTRFHGSQRQVEVRTVQSVVEDALLKLSWPGVSIIMAGRTDTGVHASGQVIAFDLEWNHPVENLGKALNSLLPDDVAVRRISQTTSDFHPRFDALSRSYCYRLFCDPVRDPLKESCTWRVWPEPNLERLQATAEIFIGVHDFANFGSPMKPGASTVREVISVEWNSIGSNYEFSITANAFLYHMVRRLVYVQVKSAQGQLQFDEIRSALQKPELGMMQGLAPSHGLTLEKVSYNENNE